MMAEASNTELECLLSEAEMKIQRLVQVNSELQTEIQKKDRIVTDLKQSEGKYRLLFNNSNDAIFIAQNGHAKFANPKTVELIGYSEEDINKIPYLDLIHPEDRNYIQERKKQRLSGQDVPSTYNLRIINKAGKEIWVQLNAASVMWEGQPATINFLRDITEQKKMEAQLQQTQKMESIGTLAGGIAHDFNNILCPIIGYAEILKHTLPNHADLAQKNITEILKAANRARDLIKQILTFCSPKSQERKPVHLQPIIEESMKLLRAVLPSTISLSCQIEQDCGLILGDATQIHQIIMNLCTNAFHAMEDNGGKITLELKPKQIENTGQEDNLSDGFYVQLTVRDTGPGIEPENLKRIFDPYFTTKEPHKGTGLGLSLVHGIVKSHDGNIRVYTQKGAGTAFHVFFPIISGVSQVETLCPADDLPQISARILFVDDEQQIVEMAEQMLTRLGFHVTALTDSNKAIEAFRKKLDHFDVVVTDLTMPNMTGDRLAAEILAIRQDMPIILCTGFSGQVSRERAAAAGIRRYILKPYLMRDLARTIQDLLQKKDRRREDRFKADNGAMVSFAAMPDKQWPLVDISKGGLSFRDIESPEYAMPRKDLGTLSILLTEKGFYLADLPLGKQTYALVEYYQPALGNMRRCGIEFGPLSSEQDIQLEHFIKRYTSGAKAEKASSR